jgi:hypothetical protein
MGSLLGVTVGDVFADGGQLRCIAAACDIEGAGA